MTVTAPREAAAEASGTGATRLVDRVFKMRELAILVVFTSFYRRWLNRNEQQLAI